MQHFVSHQVDVLSGAQHSFPVIAIDEINLLPLHHTFSLIYMITKGLSESKVHYRYRKSDVGICSSIDSINVTIRRSTSASPWTRFFSDSNS